MRSHIQTKTLRSPRHSAERAGAYGAPLRGAMAFRFASLVSLGLLVALAVFVVPGGPHGGMTDLAHARTSESANRTTQPEDPVRFEPPAIVTLDEQPGRPIGPTAFNGTPWGTHRDDLASFVKLKQKGNAEFYFDSEEDYRVEGFPQPRIVYGFLEDRLFAVYMDVDSPELYEKLLREKTALWGEPRIVDEQEVYVKQWRFKHLKVKLKQNKRTGSMKLAFYYMPLYEHVQLAGVEMGEAFEDIEEERMDQLYWLEIMRMRDKSMP